MHYQVLARKWRPRSFSAMVGQAAVQKALRSMLQSQKLPHAFLFSGTRGVGKTTLARLFAKCMLCEVGVSEFPCGECAQCVAVDTGTHLDVTEVDAASRTKVEDTRDLMENVPYAPHSGRFKIYIIDEVHMLSNHSFNALLKTLEEPPAHVKFIFATTEPEKCPITMLSRCVHFTLKPLTVTELATHLQTVCEAENLAFETPALKLLAEKAKGSVRDALTLLEEARHVGEGQVLESAVQSMLGLLSEATLLPLIEALVYKDPQLMLQSIAKIDAMAPDYHEVLQQVIGLWHSIAVYQITQCHTLQLILPQTVARYAGHFSAETIQLFYQMALKGQSELSLACDPKMGFEMVMLRMLAFQAVPLEIVTHKEVAVKPVAVAAPVAQPVRAPVAPAPLPEIQAAKPVVVPAPPAHTPPKTGTSLNWLEVMPQLNLSGLTKVLAEGAALIHQASDLWTFAISPKLAPMMNKMQTDKIGQALSDHLKQKMAVQFEVKETSFETPALHQAMAQSVRQDEITAQVQEDSELQDLIKSFDATIEKVVESKDHV